MTGDIYFSADVETDGPIPGEYSMLSFALVAIGTYDGEVFRRYEGKDRYIYKELKPISDRYQDEAIAVNGLDRSALKIKGDAPSDAMRDAFNYVTGTSIGFTPVIVAFPVSFDWSFLYWYFIKFCESGSPFGYSHCLDIKTAWSIKSSRPIATSGRSGIPQEYQSRITNTHHAFTDADAQAEVFLNIMGWNVDVSDQRPA